MFNGEIIFHLQRIMKSTCQMWTSGFNREEHIFLQKGRNCKTLLKENYGIALCLDSCYLGTYLLKKCWTCN